MTKPTAAQLEHCRLAEADIIELVGRLQGEGMDLRVIMAAIATASANIMLKAWGPQAVPSWFAQQAALTTHLAAGN